MSIPPSSSPQKPPIGRQRFIVSTAVNATVTTPVDVGVHLVPPAHWSGGPMCRCSVDPATHLAIVPRDPTPSTLDRKLPGATTAARRDSCTWASEWSVRRPRHETSWLADCSPVRTAAIRVAASSAVCFASVAEKERTSQHNRRASALSLDSVRRTLRRSPGPNWGSACKRHSKTAWANGRRAGRLGNPSNAVPVRACRCLCPTPRVNPRGSTHQQPIEGLLCSRVLVTDRYCD